MLSLYHKFEGKAIIQVLYSFRFTKSSSETLIPIKRALFRVIKSIWSWTLKVLQCWKWYSPSNIICTHSDEYILLVLMAIISKACQIFPLNAFTSEYMQFIRFRWKLACTVSMCKTNICQSTPESELFHFRCNKSKTKRMSEMLDFGVHLLHQWLLDDWFLRIHIILPLEKQEWTLTKGQWCKNQYVAF